MLLNENFLAEYFNKEILDKICRVAQKKDAEDIEEKEDEEDDD